MRVHMVAVNIPSDIFLENILGHVASRRRPATQRRARRRYFTFILRI